MARLPFKVIRVFGICSDLTYYPLRIRDPVIIEGHFIGRFHLFWDLSDFLHLLESLFIADLCGGSGH